MASKAGVMSPAIASVVLLAGIAALAQQSPPGEVGLDGPEVDHGRRAVNRDCLVRAPEECPDPRCELTQAEGLGHVVVGP